MDSISVIIMPQFSRLLIILRSSPSFITLLRGQIIYVIKYTRMDQAKFRRGYLPQISLGPFSTTLAHMQSLLKLFVRLFKAY